MDITGYKGMIFDLDGTLIASDYVWTEVDRSFLNRRGFEVPADYCKAVSAMNFMQAAEYTKARFALTDSLDDIIAEWHNMAVCEYRDNVKALPYAREFLEKAHKTGIKTALATASDRSLYEPALKRNGMYGLLDAFTQTSEVQRGKGFPDVYLLAAERLGLAPEECIVFEDILEGIKGAKAGGFAACAVYNERFSADIPQMKAAADIFIESYGQIL